MRYSHPLMISAAVLALGLTAAGCESREKLRQQQEENVSVIDYVRDARTNLCFAASNLYSQYGLLTNVPCTPLVLKMAGVG